MQFEKELSELRVMNQQTVDMLKVEIRSGMHKQAALMKTVNLMADSIAERNLLIEELCISIDEHSDVHPADLAQRAREKIKI